MFGYVTPLTEELKVKEHLFYKSAYCGLCKCMGKRVCSESRMTLSYDIVFLALIRLSLSEEKIELKSGRCAVSPFKKKPVLCQNPTLEYCSAVGSLLAYHNVADNVRDCRGMKRLISRILLLLSRRMRKRAALPELDGMISAKLEQLSAIEKSGDATLDSAAEVFGELLSSVFEYGLEGKHRLIAGQIGLHTGRWIYIADAIDDFYKDKKSGEFNPLDRIDPESLRCSMNLELEAVSSSVSLIDFEDKGIKNIIENIIYLGMPSKAEKLFNASSSGDGRSE